MNATWGYGTLVYAKNVTPADGVDNIRNARRLFVTGTGNLVIRQATGEGKAGLAPVTMGTFTWTAIPAGTWILDVPASWLGIEATLTTATGIIAFY